MKRKFENLNDKQKKVECYRDKQESCEKETLSLQKNTFFTPSKQVKKLYLFNHSLALYYEDAKLLIFQRKTFQFSSL